MPTLQILLQTLSEAASTSAERAPDNMQENGIILKLLQVVQAPKTTSDQLGNIAAHLVEHYGLDNLDAASTVNPLLFVLYADIHTRLFRQRYRRYFEDVYHQFKHHKGSGISFSQIDPPPELLQQYKTAVNCYSNVVESDYLKGVLTRLGILKCEYALYMLAKQQYWETAENTVPFIDTLKEGIFLLQRAIHEDQDPAAKKELERLQQNPYFPRIKELNVNIELEDLNRQFTWFFEQNKPLPRNTLLSNRKLTAALKRLLQRNTTKSDTDTNRLTSRNLAEIHFFLGEAKFTQAAHISQKEEATDTTITNKLYRKAAEHYASVPADETLHGEALFHLGRLAMLGHLAYSLRKIKDKFPLLSLPETPGKLTETDYQTIAQAYIDQAEQTGYTLGAGGVNSIDEAETIADKPDPFLTSLISDQTQLPQIPLTPPATRVDKYSTITPRSTFRRQVILSAVVAVILLACAVTAAVLGAPLIALVILGFAIFPAILAIQFIRHSKKQGIPIFSAKSSKRIDAADPYAQQQTQAPAAAKQTASTKSRKSTHGARKDSLEMQPLFPRKQRGGEKALTEGKSASHSADSLKPKR